jgi:hypothetical protein
MRNIAGAVSREMLSGDAGIFVAGITSDVAGGSFSSAKAYLIWKASG